MHNFGKAKIIFDACKKMQDFDFFYIVLYKVAKNSIDDLASLTSYGGVI